MTMWRLLRTLVCTAPLTLLLLTTPAQAADDFLEPEKAFPVSARMLDAKRVEVRFDIAPGYYLYRERFNAELAPAAFKMAELQVPKGKVKYDENFQKDVEYFRQSATLVVVLQEAATSPFKLTVGNQGCADKGLCYTPQKRSFKIDPGHASGGAPRVSALSESQAQAWEPAVAPEQPPVAARSAAAALAAATGGAAAGVTAGATAGALSEVAAPAAAGTATAPEESGEVSRALKSGNAALVAGLFVLLGLGLSFTPCVLPMMPILSSIIVGRGGSVSKARGFLLALAYSLGMAVVYTAMGVASALAGDGLGAALQNAWVLGGFALLLAVFSLSMFGVYELQMPAALQNRLTQVSQGFQGGQYLGVFAMGAVSTLIVGPCVAAPLAGTLLYISQTRDVALGATALFSMAVGMSVPLLLLGLSAGTLLPKAGAWMTHVKSAFGVMLLGVALWMASPVLPAWALMALCALVLVVAAVYLGAFRALPKPAAPARVVAKLLGLLLGLFAVAQVVGAASGGRELMRPLAHWGAAPAAAHKLPFKAITSVAELDAEVRASTRPVMLDFYADWCVACVEFEKFTFTDEAVRQKMAGLTLLRVDVTANTANDKALLRRYSLFGPPALLFFAPAGNELPGSRVIGYQDAAKFGAHLDRVARQP